MSQIWIEREKYSLSGRLDLPGSESPHPAIIFVHGSGATHLEVESRYAFIREAFARAGIACLMWDKPGCGRSGGAFREFQSYRKRAQEVIAAAYLLRERSDIDGDRIGLWGISEGTWVCLTALEYGVDVALMILVSGPGGTLASAAEYIARTNLALEGYPPAEIDYYLKVVAECLQLCRSGASYEAFLEASRPLRENSFFQLTGWNRVGRAEFERSALRDNLSIQTKDLLSSVSCPVLAIFGDKDTQVDWKESATVYQQTLAEAGNRDVTIKVFPDANHNIRRCRAGSVRETRHPNRRQAYAGGYVPAMLDWLKVGQFTS